MSSEDLLPIDDPLTAELAAAEWMRRLGFVDAYADGVPGADGGIDVESAEGLAQVKHYANPVGIAEIQRLAGISYERDKEGLFFALNGYTRQAVDSAEKTDLLLFTYSPDGRLEPNTSAAMALLHNSPVEATDLGVASSHFSDEVAGISPTMSDIEINKIRAALQNYIQDLGPNQSEDQDHLPAIRLTSQLELLDRPVPELRELARTRFAPVVLASRLCPESEMRRAISDISDRTVPSRLAVANNTACSPQLLRQILESDPSDPVRVSAARNESATATVLRAASGDPSIVVRRAVIEHPNAPHVLVSSMLSAEPDLREYSNAETPSAAIVRSAAIWWYEGWGELNWSDAEELGTAVAVAAILAIPVGWLFSSFGVWLILTVFLIPVAARAEE